MLPPMFNIGMSEMILIAILALIFIGPKQLPEIARTVGRALNELKRATEEITGQVTSVKDQVDRSLRKTNSELRGHLDFMESSPQKSVPTSSDKAEVAGGSGGTGTKSASLKEKLKRDLQDRI